MNKYVKWSGLLILAFTLVSLILYATDIINLPFMETKTTYQQRNNRFANMVHRGTEPDAALTGPPKTNQLGMFENKKELLSALRPTHISLLPQSSLQASIEKRKPLKPITEAGSV